jgi:hypothetical protein
LRCLFQEVCTVLEVHFKVMGATDWVARSTLSALCVSVPEDRVNKGRIYLAQLLDLFSGYMHRHSCRGSFIVEFVAQQGQLVRKPLHGCRACKKLLF